MAVTTANSTPYSNVEYADIGKLGILRPDGKTTKINADGLLEGVASPEFASQVSYGTVRIEPDVSKRTITVDRRGKISGASNVGIAKAPIYGTDTDGNEVIIRDGEVGVVKPDGTTMEIDSNGYLKSKTYVDVATTTTMGLVKPDGTTTVVDKDTGVLSSKIDLSKLDTFQGATDTSDGKVGIVPAPKIEERDEYLMGNGTWGEAVASVEEEFDTLTHKRIKDLKNADVDEIIEGIAQDVNISTDKNTPTTADGFIIDGETDLCTPTENKIYLDKRSKIPFRWKIDDAETGEGHFESIELISLYTYRKCGDNVLASKITKKILETTVEMPIQVDMIRFLAISTSNADVKLYMQCPRRVTAKDVNGEDAICTSLAGFKVVRREEHYPESVDDGKLVIDVPYKDFYKYKDTPYEDVDVETEVMYYYAAFPYSQTGYICKQIGDKNKSSAMSKEYEKYGFDIWQEVANPEERVKYPDDVLNKNYPPIIVNQDEDTFYLGEWANTFFMKLIRPVMLKSNGEVDYELDHDDQTIRVNGLPSDISNLDYNGNAMVEFPKMYFARWTDAPTTIDGRTVTISHVRISNMQLNPETDSAGNVVAEYKCYAHMTDAR